MERTNRHEANTNPNLSVVEEAKKESGSETSTPKVGTPSVRAEHTQELVDSFEKFITKSTVELDDTLVATGDVFLRKSLPRNSK